MLILYTKYHVQWDLVYLDPKDLEYSVNLLVVHMIIIKFLDKIFKIQTLWKLHVFDAWFEDMENSKL